MGVKGGNSTFANEDTSGATTLPPSKDASSRPDEEYEPSGPGGAKYAEAPSGGQPKFPGKMSNQGYEGGSTAAKEAISGKSSSSGTGNSGTSKGADTSKGSDASKDSGASDSSGAQKEDSTGTGEELHMDPAPTYVQNVITNHGSVGDKPKGKNLHEGIDEDGKNASFDMRGEPGNENDPGRASLKEFQTKTATAVGAGPRQTDIDGEGQFDALKADENLE